MRRRIVRAWLSCCIRGPSFPGIRYLCTTTQNTSGSINPKLKNPLYTKRKNFKVSQDATVHDATKHLVLSNNGALIVVNASDQFCGILTERDLVCKVELLGRDSKQTKVSEIAMMVSKTCDDLNADDMVVTNTYNIEACIQKMLAMGTRHLPLVNGDDHQILGVVSMNDLLKEMIVEQQEIQDRVADLRYGNGVFF
eukprot:25503_1